MFGRRKQNVVPDDEKKQLKEVKSRLDKLEPRVGQLESQLKLIRREP